MALLAPVIVAAALLEHRHLVGLGLGDDLGRDGEAGGRLEVGSVAGEQNIAQRDAVARTAVELLDDDLVSRGDAILLAARAHDCEHWLFSSLKTGPARASSCKRLRAKASRLWQAPYAVNHAGRFDRRLCRGPMSSQQPRPPTKVGVTVLSRREQ